MKSTFCAGRDIAPTKESKERADSRVACGLDSVAAQKRGSGTLRTGYVTTSWCGFRKDEGGEYSCKGGCFNHDVGLQLTYEGDIQYSVLGGLYMIGYISLTNTEA